MERAKILHEKMKEELHDVLAYAKLHDELEDEGMHHDAEIIEDLARDEYDHAHALCRMIHHHEMDEEAKALWKEARAAFEEEE